MSGDIPGNSFIWSQLWQSIPDFILCPPTKTIRLKKKGSAFFFKRDTHFTTKICNWKIKLVLYRNHFKTFVNESRCHQHSMHLMQYYFRRRKKGLGEKNQCLSWNIWREELIGSANSPVTLNKLLCLADPGFSAVKCSQKWGARKPVGYIKDAKYYISGHPLLFVWTRCSI